MPAGRPPKRCVVSPDGTVLGAGPPVRATRPLSGSAAAVAIGAAVREALGPHDPAGSSRAWSGVAGVSMLADRGVAAAFTGQWTGDRPDLPGARSSATR